MSKTKILIVDDEPKVAFFFQKHLELLSDEHEVTAVNSGTDALALLREQSFALMITDLRMPGMDGLELLAHVHQISPRTRTILVTAYGSENVWEEAERLNTFRALSKPIQISDLVSAVQEALVQPESVKSQSGVVVLTGENYHLLGHSLEELRVNLGARATILADTGGRVLVQAGAIEGFNIAVAMSLLGGKVAASNVLAEKLKYRKPVHLSYFEGPPYDIYASSVNQQFFLTIVQDRRKEASRIGLVWLYTKRTIKELSILLGNRDVSMTAELGQAFAKSVQSELDSLLGASEFDVKKAPKGGSQAKTLPSLRQRMEALLYKFQKQTGINTESRLEDLDIVQDQDMAALILQTVGESLKNAYQHAKPTIVGVSFLHERKQFHGRVADDGIGFNMHQPPPLRTMKKLQKRFKKQGGKLTLSAYPAQGTNVVFRLPIEEATKGKKI